MALTKGGYCALELKELLEEHFRHRTIANVSYNATSPAAFQRRVYDIMHDKVERVSLRVTDEICSACGRPDWLAIL